MTAWTRRCVRLAGLSVLASFAIVLSGCPAPMGFNVSISGGGQLQVNQTVQLAANVTGAEGNVTYAWTANGPGVITDPTSATTGLTGTAPGTVTVTVQATDEATGNTVSDSIALQVTGAAPPEELQITATAEPDVVGIGETVDLTGDVTGGQQPFTFAWTQTGGPVVTIANSNQANPSVTLSEVGTYTFEAEVTDAVGAVAADAVSVNVQEEPPLQADFTFTPASPVVNQAVRFDANDTIATSRISTFAWNFGDGSEIVDTDQAVTDHTFRQQGRFNVQLTVTDEFGRTNSITREVAVSPAGIPPIARFTVVPPDGVVGQTVTFDATTSEDPDGQIVEYQWSFGDGAAVTSGAVPQTTHVYGRGGTFTATLTVTDSSGLVDDAEQLVVISQES
ncbi:MAG: PKD domain-containing protein [Phycisphaerae bacterium]|nr:PKD domain-containing protein [Phycisphaerae bacterium]